MSKFSLDVLNRCVFPYMKSKDPDVILGAEFGEDVSLTKVNEGILVSHVDPIVGAVKHIGWLAVHVACNDIATSGAPPRWILLLVMVPKPDDEALIEEIMQDAARGAKETGVAIIGGHTGYSATLSRPLVAVTALGTLSGKEPVLTKGARVGDHIFVTKGIGLEGTAILAIDFYETARRLGMSEKEIQKGEKLYEKVSVIPEALLLAEAGASAMHDVTRGGLIETLLEIARSSGVGIRVEEKRIQIPEIVKRFSEVFQFDPLKMISSGTLAVAIPPDKVEAAKVGLKKAGITYRDIGEVVEGWGVEMICDGHEERYTEIQAEEDELARMWERYQRT